MLGLERVIDFVFDAWDYIRPWVIVDPYEQGLVLTFGRPYKRGRKGDMVITGVNGWFNTGLHLKIPLAERESMAITAIRTIRTSGQSLTTKDEMDVTVSTAMRFRITNVIPLLTEITEVDDVMRDSIAIVVADIITTRDWSELRNSSEISELFKQNIRKYLNPYGFKILQATFVDFTRAPVMRHIVPETFTIIQE